jgi:tetratricopeptide (TPR) repeat protein
MKDDFEKRFASVAAGEQRAFFLREVALLEEAVAADGMQPLQIQVWMDELAHALESIGEMERAIGIRERLLAFSLEHVGDEDDATIGHMENLGKDLYRVESYHSAVGLLAHVLEVRRRTLGERDPLTVETQGDLATALVRDGQFERAIELNRDLLRYYEDNCGVHDQRTITAREQLDNAFKWREADRGK